MANTKISALSTTTVTGTELVPVASSGANYAVTVNQVAAKAVAGSNTQVQFNNNGTMAGDSGLTYNNTTKTLSVGGAVGGTAATTAITVNPTWSTTGAPTALQVNVTDTSSDATSKLLDLQVGGVSKFLVDKTGAASLTGQLNIFNGLNITTAIYSTGSGVRMTSVGNLIWQSSPTTLNGLDSLVLTYDAANTLAQRNGVNAQAFNLYNTYTSGTVYERGFMRWNANVLEIGNEAAGGTQRNVRIIGANNNTLEFGDANGFIARSSASNTINFAPATGTVAMALTLASLTVYSSAIIGLYAASGNVPQTFSINPAARGGNGGAGHNLAISAGAGSTATTGTAGGDVSIAGGAANGTGNNNGGNINLSGGTATGTGHRGYVLMPNLPTSATGLPTGALWNNAGVLSIA